MNENRRLPYIASVMALLGIVFLNATGQAGVKDRQTAPASVVKQFLTFHFSQDMGFTPEAVKQRSAWLTSEMMEACRAYFAIPQNPDEPPFINGDPFTGTQEYPQTFSAGAAKSTKTSARVDISFHWKEAPSRKAVVLLKRLNGKWLIDDIEFPDQESMRKTLAAGAEISKERQP